MPQTKTDLNQLVIFAKVVDTCSFTAAGRALGLPKSTVSRKVAQLEQRLGVQLLHRTTRKLSLTDVGAALYERCSRIATEIDEATEAILSMDDEPRGLLRVATPPLFGSSLFAGVSGAFLTHYPEIDLELRLVGGQVDLISGGFDIALSVGSQPPPHAELLGTELGHVDSKLVASVDYLERLGRPSSLEQLRQHAFVALDHHEPLALLDREDQAIELDRRPRLAVNDLALVRDAVLAGVGLGILPRFCCDADIQAGQLRTLDDWRAPALAVYAQYPTSRHLATKVRAFIDFMREHLAARPRLGSRASMPTLLHEQARPTG